MKSRRAIPVALMLIATGALFATPARSEPDRMRITRSCVVSADGRPRALSPESLVPRARAPLAAPNQLSVTFVSVDEPWTPQELELLRTYVAALLPVLEDVCGPPSGPDVVNVIKDSTLPEQGYAGTYTPGRHEIRLYPVGYYTLCHELAHAFHGDDVVYWDGYEEGMADAASVEALTRLAHDPMDDSGPSLAVYYELLNQPAISPHEGYFWEGMPAVNTRYGLAGYLWRKVEIEHPGFLKEFNRRYYEALPADPSLRRSVSRLDSLAAEIAPTMEGLPFSTWADRQYVLGTQPQLGVQLYQFAPSTVVSLFYRHADGREDVIPYENVEWKATDGDQISAGSGSLETNWAGAVSISPDVSALARGALRLTISSSTPYGSQTSTSVRPLKVGTGLFGVVRGASEGSVTITSLDSALPPETVPVHWGVFEAPSWKTVAGRFELRYSDLAGRWTTHRLTKDASSYLALLDAPPGPVAEPSAMFMARPSISITGCRFVLNRPIPGPAHVTLYSVTGKVMRVLAVPPGARGVDWDALGSDGLFASAGVYVARLTAPGVDERTRFVVTH